jgi:guanine deaminase
VYGSVHPQASQALFKVLDRRKMRAIAGPVLMDSHSPSDLMLPTELAIPMLEELVDTWHGHDRGRLKLAVLPRFALSCSMKMMKAAGEFARDHKLLVSTHLSENLAECREAESRFGTDDYLSVYEEAGLVHSRSLFAHCVHLSLSEWERMRGAGAMVAHCPDANRFLASGSMPVQEPRDRGVPILLGSDVAGGRTFRMGRVAAGAFDNGLQNDVSLPLRELLWWATRGSALHLGEKQVGAISPGLDADLLWIDVPSWCETEDQILSWVLLDHDAPRPRRTWVRGQCVWDRAGWSRTGGGFPWLNDPRTPPGIG